MQATASMASVACHVRLPTPASADLWVAFGKQWRSALDDSPLPDLNAALSI
jgi:hypothetical protein